MPKSDSFAWPSRATRMLDGLTSRWTIAGRVRGAERLGDLGQDRARPAAWRQRAPARGSARRASCPRRTPSPATGWSPSSTRSNTATTLGWLSCAAIRASRSARVRSGLGPRRGEADPLDRDLAAEHLVAGRATPRPCRHDRSRGRASTCRRSPAPYLGRAPSHPTVATVPREPGAAGLDAATPSPTQERLPRVRRPHPPRRPASGAAWSPTRPISTRCAQALAAGSVRFYVGFDPTAPSLHMGNLVQIVTARRLQDAGHTPYALVGGATGMIGDPQGLRGAHPQLARHRQGLGRAGPRPDRAVPRLRRRQRRDHGQQLRLDREAVDDRLPPRHRQALPGQPDARARRRERRLEAGISYTEFSYVLLQSMDFLELYRDHGVDAAVRRLRPVGQPDRRRRADPPRRPAARRTPSRRR